MSQMAKFGEQKNVTFAFCFFQCLKIQVFSEKHTNILYLAVERPDIFLLYNALFAGINNLS